MESTAKECNAALVFTMELHSYAKRKVTKKWSIEHKRQLVEARINNDRLFTNKPTASVAPWKRIVSLARLDDYNVFFVRKQWSNMINKYKQYKLSRLDVLPDDAQHQEEIQKLSQEWEFFEPIHRFMSHKATNLHSYALPVTVRMPGPPPSAALHEDDDDSSVSSTNALDAYSSDTNYDFDGTIRNTDHDFYTKKNVLPLNYFADESDDTKESVLMIEQPVTCNGVTEGMEQVRLHVAGEQIVEIKMEPQCVIEEKTGTVQVQPKQEQQQQLHQQVFNDTNMQQMPSTSADSANRLRNLQRRTIERPLSERDRYYRHKRHFNHRLERRFDALLSVFGQIVKAEYPNINVSPLLGAAAAEGVTLAQQLFKSEDESVDEENESSSSSEEQHQMMAEETNEVAGNQNGWQNQQQSTI